MTHDAIRATLTEIVKLTLSSGDYDTALHALELLMGDCQSGERFSVRASCDRVAEGKQLSEFETAFLADAEAKASVIAKGRESVTKPSPRFYIDIFTHEVRISDQSSLLFSSVSNMVPVAADTAIGQAILRNPDSFGFAVEKLPDYRNVSELLANA